MSMILEKINPFSITTSLLLLCRVLNNCLHRWNIKGENVCFRKKICRNIDFCIPSSMSVDNKKIGYCSFMLGGHCCCATEFHINCKLVFARAQNYSICLTISTFIHRGAWVLVGMTDSIFFSFCDVCLWEFITFSLVYTVYYAKRNAYITGDHSRCGIYSVSDRMERKNSCTKNDSSK